MAKKNIWYCKIGETDALLIGSADGPMRESVKRAYRFVTGMEPEFIFSGWGGILDESERAVVENRMPVESVSDLIEALKSAEEIADRLGDFDTTINLRELIADVKANA